nr:MAG TPA: hypothetical protein [Caudoviricetes sp.]
MISISSFYIFSLLYSLRLRLPVIVYSRCIS